MTDSLDDRLHAVERSLGTDDEPSDTAEAGEATDADLAARLDDVERRLREVEAATQAVRGYVGAVRDGTAERTERSGPVSTADRLEAGGATRHPAPDADARSGRGDDRSGGGSGLLERLDRWL